MDKRNQMVPRDQEAPRGQEMDPRNQKVSRSKIELVKELKKNKDFTKLYKEWLKGNI